VVDPSVNCSATPSDVGFTCTSGLLPTQTYPALSCGAGLSSSGGLQYCCSGNWCNQTESPSLTTDNGDASCTSCYVANCGALACACDPTNSGGTVCDEYENKVANCYINTPGDNQTVLTNCESQLAPQYGASDVATGNVDLECTLMFCDGPCQLSN
jgi:hypothetical protein